MGVGARVRSTVGGFLRRLLPRPLFNWLRCHWPSARGGDLILLGIVWGATGLNILETDPDPRQTVPIEYFGEPIRAAFWFAGSIIAIAVALGPDSKFEWVGFTALMVPAAMRAVSYLVAWVSALLSGDQFGFAGLWPDALSWCAICLLVYRLARKAEITPDVAKRVDRYNEERRRRRFRRTV